MPNRWGIPKEIETLVRQRDRACVYCGVPFGDPNAPFRNKPSWEHILNDIRMNTSDNIARCCRSCNASKGSKSLSDWLGSHYCQRKGITEKSLAPVVQRHLLRR